MRRPRIFTAGYNAGGSNWDSTLYAGSGEVLELRSFEIGSILTATGSANESHNRVRFWSLQGGTPSGGVFITPQPLEAGAAAFSGTLMYGGSVTGGTLNFKQAFGYNTRAGFSWNGSILVSPGDGLRFDNNDVLPVSNPRITLTFAVIG